MEDGEGQENNYLNNEQNGTAYNYWTQEETNYLIDVSQKANSRKECCEAFRKRYKRTDFAIKNKFEKLQREGIIDKWYGTAANPSSTVTNQSIPIGPSSSSGAAIPPLLHFLKDQAMAKRKRLSIQDECSNFKKLNPTGQSSEELCAKAIDYFAKEFQIQPACSVDRIATVLYCYGIELTPKAINRFSETSVFQLTDADRLTFFLNERIKLGYRSSTQRTIFKVSSHTLPPFLAHISQNCVLPKSRDDVVQEYMNWVKNDHEKEKFAEAYDVFTTSNILQFDFPNPLTKIKTLFMTQVPIDDDCYKWIRHYGEFKLDEENKIEKFKSKWGEATLDRAVKEVSSNGVRKRAGDPPRKTESNKKFKGSQILKVEEVKEEEVEEIDASNLAITQNTSRQESLASRSATVAPSPHYSYVDSERAASQERHPNNTQNTSSQRGVASGSVVVTPSPASRVGSEKAASQERSIVANSAELATPPPPQQSTAFNKIRILKLLEQAVKRIKAESTETAPNSMNDVLTSIESAIKASHSYQKVPAEAIRKTIEKNLKQKIMRTTYRVPDSKISMTLVLTQLRCIVCPLKLWEFETLEKGLRMLNDNYELGYYNLPSAVEEFFNNVLAAIIEAST